MINQTTSNNKTDKLLTSKELEQAINLLHDGSEEPLIHHIDQSVGVLQSILSRKGVNNAVTILYGIPIYERNYVPENEFWLIDKNNKIIRKFFLTSSSL